MHCAVCSSLVTTTTSRPYTLGCVRGRVCLDCQQGLSAAVNRWLKGRLLELEQQLGGRT